MSGTASTDRPGAEAPRAGGSRAGRRAVPLADPVVVAAAAAAPDWATLAAAARGCTACAELADTRTQVVVGDRPGSGGGRARVVLVGEAPGAQEDADGRPFVGKAGQLLDGVLAGAGLDRREVGVLNVLKCRPPGNRPPRPDEVEHCRPWLTRQLGMLEPDVVVPLGRTATAWFLGRRITLGAVRGRVHEVDGLRVLPTYHPSAAIRFGPDGAPLAALREDLAAVAALVGSGTGETRAGGSGTGGSGAPTA